MTIKTWFYLHASVHIYIDGTRLRLPSALRVKARIVRRPYRKTALRRNALRNETENLA